MTLIKSNVGFLNNSTRVIEEHKFPDRMLNLGESAITIIQESHRIVKGKFLKY